MKIRKINKHIKVQDKLSNTVFEEEVELNNDSIDIDVSVKKGPKTTDTLVPFHITAKSLGKLWEKEKKVSSEFFATVLIKYLSAIDSMQSLQDLMRESNLDSSCELIDEKFISEATVIFNKRINHWLIEYLFSGADDDIIQLTYSILSMEEKPDKSNKKDIREALKKYIVDKETDPYAVKNVDSKGMVVSRD